MQMRNGNGNAPDLSAEIEASTPARSFVHEGEEWLAWLSGAGAYGTGTFGPASLEAVHFAKAADPGTPLYEALLPAGRFHGLFDDELVELLRRASRIPDPEDRPAKPISRRGVGLL